MKRKTRVRNKIRRSEHAFKRTGDRIHSGKSRRETVQTQQSVGAQRRKQAKDVHAQTLELARANWQASVQAEFKGVQKLASGRTD